MSVSGDVALSASALRLVDTAERLFADRGIEGVSLRQVAIEAGSANNSAVHYHFGSRAGLITAIFGYRLPQIARERRLLAARSDPADLRARLESQYLPVLALADAARNRYVSFVEQLQLWQPGGQFFASLPGEHQQSDLEFRRDIQRILAHLPDQVCAMRIVDAQACFLHAAATRERAIEAGEQVVDLELFEHALLDEVTGLLTTAPSPATLRHLAQNPQPTGPRLRLL
jgi:AcrR family transcriptional regulator